MPFSNREPPQSLLRKANIELGRAAGPPEEACLSARASGVAAPRGVKVAAAVACMHGWCSSCIDGAYSPEWWFSMPAKCVCVQTRTLNLNHFTLS